MTGFIALGKRARKGGGAVQAARSRSPTPPCAERPR
jgi:hypothetical protein